MILHFEPNLQFQLDAINSVVCLFEGQSMEQSAMDFNLQEKDTFDFIDGVANRLLISEEQMLANLQKVQEENEIAVSSQLNGTNFSIEMETGTGKTVTTQVPFS